MLLLSLLGVASAGRYAILYAGSNTWSNYRHQADIFTLYNKLLKNGYKASEILLMGYDDIANHEQNPFKGCIWHDLAHSANQYPGAEAINVTGDKMTAKGFYKAIEDMPTTKEDYVFIYYDDHGSVGILGVPEGCGEFITADELDDAFSKAQGKWKTLLFGVEACYAGSTGEMMSADDFACITASNGRESSWATTSDSSVGTFLSNLFTNVWLAEMDEHPTQTVGELFDNLIKGTTKSHPQFFGDERIKDMTVDVFFGKGEPTTHNRVETDAALPRVATLMALEHAKVHSQEASVRLAARTELIRMQGRSELLDGVLDAIIKEIDPKDDPTLRDATDARIPEGYFSTVKVFTRRFGKINPDDGDRFMIIKNLCIRFGYKRVIAAIKKVI